MTGPSRSLPSFERTTERLAGPDLARTIAITEVILCHDGGMMTSWWHKSFPFHLSVLGFWGVMLFFVLSGFLIGTIMLDLLDRNAPALSWGLFLVRRWMRTLPAYYACFLLLVVPLAYFGPYGVPWDVARRVLFRYLSLTQNLWNGMVSNWYGQTWSLCVEEWFYLLFPLFLVAALFLCHGRRCHKDGIFLSVVGLFFIVPILWRLTLPYDVNWDEITSKIVFCRLDSIAWGIAGAWLYRRFSFYRNTIYGTLCAGIVILLPLWWGTNTRYTYFIHMGLFDLAGLGYALCIPAMMRLKTLPSPLNALVRTISTHSYGLYLIHLPLVLLAGDLHTRFGLPPLKAVAFTVATTILGSAFLWHCVERPFLTLRPRQR